MSERNITADLTFMQKYSKLKWYRSNHVKMPIHSFREAYKYGIWSQVELNSHMSCPTYQLCTIS